jgi:PAS domain S-box-containing protein
MKDSEKSRDQLVYEISEARQRIAQLEALAATGTRSGATVEQTSTRYKALFENATEGILVAEIESGRLVYANAAALRIVGYGEGELLGLQVRDLHPEIDRAHCLREFAERAHGRSLGASALPFQRKDGTRVFVDLTATLGVVGGRECVIDFLRDVTERTLAEAEIRKSRNDLLSILGMLRIVTMIVDREGRISFLNSTGLELLGASETDILGLPWEEVFPMSPRDRANVRLGLSGKEARTARIPVTMDAAEGKRYWMDAEIHPDPSEEERRIIFLYDMTEVHLLRDELDQTTEFEGMLGHSAAMKQLYKEIVETARVDWTVLIEGETGTGKELVARAIHNHSERHDRPFVPVNCAGLTDSLLSSQLFGHKRGSFTGAVSDEKGVFEAANGGTVLLDEIGDISPFMQTSLLRVLETREVTRVGESLPRKVDFRVLASTHRDLAREVSAGRFREDLYYRLRSARVLIPPLRQRTSDIPLLAAEFVEQSALATGKSVQGITHQAMRVLLQYPWPGNVRELRSAVEHAVLRTSHELLQLTDLPPEVREGGRMPQAEGASEGDERERVLAALVRANGNRTLAARLLGVSRATFYRTLDRLGVTP